jgi:hypothetical protein
MPEEIGEYVMSEESGNMRRLWEACKTVSTDDIRAQARGSNLGGDETRCHMVVEELFRRATEGGLTFSSDKTKPGFKTVQTVVKNLNTNGDFIHMEWESYNSEGDELRALRLRRQRQAAGSGWIPKRATISTMMALQDVLELRANAHDVAQQVPAPVYSEFHAKLLRLYRAEVPPGFRPPNLPEIRKADRDIHEELFRWVAVGDGQLAAGLAAYTAGAEKDSPLWAPALPAETRLPDRGAEAASNIAFNDESIPGPSTRSSQQPSLRDHASDRMCRVCKHPLSDHTNLRFCKEPKTKGGKGAGGNAQQDNRHRSRSPRRKGDGKNQGSPSGRRPRGPPPPCPHWMLNCFTRAPDSYSPNPGADICLDFNKPDKKCRGRKCMRCHDCPRVMPDGSMCGEKHPNYEHD